MSNLTHWLDIDPETGAIIGAISAVWTEDHQAPLTEMQMDDLRHHISRLGPDQIEAYLTSGIPNSQVLGELCSQVHRLVAPPLALIELAIEYCPAEYGESEQRLQKMLLAFASPVV